MQNTQFNIAIVGGGIGGLVLALTIANNFPDFNEHMQIDIYESTSNLKAQVGAGIGVWPNSWTVFRSLGIDKELLKFTSSRVTDELNDNLLIRRADLPEARDLFYIHSGDCLFFHRGEFQAVLLDSLPSSIKIHTQKRLRTYTQTNAGVDLEFEDNSSVFANMVVGADGVQSRVRKTMIGELMKQDPSLNIEHQIDPSWTGVITYRSLIPREKLAEAGWGDHRGLKDWVVYSGHSGAIMAYPVLNESHVNFVGFKMWAECEGTKFSQELLESLLEKEGYTRAYGSEEQIKSMKQHQAVSNESDPWSENGGGGRAGVGRGKWVARVDSEEVKHVYRGWEPEVQALVDTMEVPLAWAVHRVGPLETFINGKVCLLGDAAHAMHPQQGVGAGMAINDAYLLGSMIASQASKSISTLQSSLASILHVYDSIRRPSGDYAAGGARANAFHYCLRLPVGDDEKTWRKIDPENEQDVSTLKGRMHTRWTHAWDYMGPKKDLEKALRMLQERA